MNLLSKFNKLNTKSKTIILLGWTVILLLVFAAITLITGLFNNKNNFGDFSNKPYDEYVSLSLRMKEVRTSSYDNANKSNGLESSKYSFDVAVIKPKQSNSDITVQIDYVNCQLVVKTKQEKLIYEDQTKGKLELGTASPVMSTTKTNLYLTFNNILKKELKNESSSVTDVDQTPEEVYLSFYYIATVTKKSENKTEKVEKLIQYKTEISNIDKIKDKKLEFKELDKDSTYGTIVKLDNNEQIVLNVDYKKGPSYSNENTIHKDEFQFLISVKNKENQIKNVSYEIIGIVENEKKDFDNKFSDKVYIASVYGMIPSSENLKIYTNEIDTNYKISQLYIISKIELNDGSSLIESYKLRISDISIAMK